MQRFARGSMTLLTPKRFWRVEDSAVRLEVIDARKLDQGLLNHGVHGKQRPK